MKVACIDFETANRTSTSACSLGLVILEDCKVIESRSWFINPHIAYRYFEPANIEIHGITPEQVQYAPEFDAVYEELLPLIYDSVLAAHYALFDMSVLKSTLALYDIACPDLNYVCTRNIARKIWTLPAYKLNVVSEHLNHEFKHHDALSDAFACANIFVKAVENKQIFNLDEFMRSINLGFGTLRALAIKKSI